MQETCDKIFPLFNKKLDVIQVMTIKKKISHPKLRLENSL